MAEAPLQAQKITLTSRGQLAGLATQINALNQAQKKAWDAQRAAMAREHAASVALMVAHDLRSPIAALEAIAPGLVFSDKEVQLLFHQALTRVMAIADRFLSEHARVCLSDALQSASVREIIEEVVGEKKLQHPRMGAGRLRVESSEEMATLFVAARASDVTTALANLLDNAIFAVAHGGEVSITARAMGSNIDFVVRDTGVGISPSILANIGKAPVRSVRPDGHGLGVFSAGQIVHAFGGRLSIRSEEGSWTEAVLSMPRATQPPPPRTGAPRM